MKTTKEHLEYLDKYIKRQNFNGAYARLKSNIRNKIKELIEDLKSQEQHEKDLNKNLSEHSGNNTKAKVVKE